MPLLVRRLLVLPLVALYFVGAFCGEGLHAIVCHHGGHSDAGHCHGDGDCSSHDSAGHQAAGWQHGRAAAIHDEQACAVCQFLAKAQLNVAAKGLGAGLPARPALPVMARSVPRVHVVAPYSPRGPPAFALSV
jgi:hypothetical protein